MSESRFETLVPQNIRDLIDDTFMKELRNQVWRIMGGGLEEFADESNCLNCEASGWMAAFWKACDTTGKMEIFEYWKSLPGFEDGSFPADTFLGLLEYRLYEKGYILSHREDLIKEKLGIDQGELVRCWYCDHSFTRDMVKVDDEEGFYICPHCQDIQKMGEDPYRDCSSTNYYKECLRGLNEATKK